MERKIKHVFYKRDCKKYEDIFAYCDMSFLMLLNSKIPQSLKQKSTKRHLRRVRKKTLLLLRSFNIKKFILTPKLFTEFIGEGKIKEKIYKKRDKKFDNFMNDFKDHFHKLENIFEAKLKQFLNDLESMFRIGFKKYLIPEKIFSQAINQVYDKPLHKKLKKVTDGVIEFADKLKKDFDFYNAFIESLVVDATISYFFRIINFKRTFSKDEELACSYLDNLIRVMLIRYIPKGLFQSDLVRLMTNINDILTEKDNPGTQVKQIIRREDDLADSEMPSLVFYGYQIKNGIYPVLVFTAEEKLGVRVRLDNGLAAIGTLRVRLKYFSLLKRDPQKICIDKQTGTIVIDAKNRNCYTRIDLTFNNKILGLHESTISF